MNTRLFNIIFCTILSLFMIQSAACKPKRQGRKESFTSVHVWKVKAVPVVREVSVPGIVEPVNSVIVSSEIGGKIETVFVAEGQEVVDNQPLLALDDADAELALAQAGAAVSQAEAMLNEAVTPARPETLAQLSAAVDAAEAASNFAKTQLENRKTLFEAKEISEEAYKAAQTSATAAEKAYMQAVEALNIAKTGATEQTKKRLEAQLVQARAAQALAKRNLDRTIIYSPLKGRVVEKFVEEGELVGPGKKTFRVITADELKLVAYTPERVMTAVSEGDAQRVLFASLDKEFTIPIHRIAFSAERSTNTFKTEFLLDNRRTNGRRPFRVGYIASIKFKVQEKENALKIPIEALVLRGLRTIVFTAVKENGAWRARANDVEIGIKRENFIEVTSGLKAGDFILVRGQRYVRDKEKIGVEKTFEGDWPW